MRAEHAAHVANAKAALERASAGGAEAAAATQRVAAAEAMGQAFEAAHAAKELERSAAKGLNVIGAQAAQLQEEVAKAEQMTKYAATRADHLRQAAQGGPLTRKAAAVVDKAERLQEVTATAGSRLTAVHAEVLEHAGALTAAEQAAVLRAAALEQARATAGVSPSLGQRVNAFSEKAAGYAAVPKHMAAKVQGAFSSAVDATTTAFGKAKDAVIHRVPGLRTYVVDPVVQYYHELHPVARASVRAATVPMLQVRAQDAADATDAADANDGETEDGVPSPSPMHAPVEAEKAESFWDSYY
jgi:hypothetical protein